MDKSLQQDPENIQQLREARDAALTLAQAAVRDSTRLTRLLTILSDVAPISELLDRALSTLSELFGADIVVLLDPLRNGSFVPLAAIGIPEENIHEVFSNETGCFTASTMNFHAPFMVDDLEANPRGEPLLRGLGARTGVWLPLAGSYAARGVLILARCYPTPFTHTEVGLLSAMTYHISLSLEQEQRNQQLRQVADLGQEIGRELDEAAVCAKAAELFPAVIGADGAALVLKGSDGLLKWTADPGFEHLLSPACIALAERLLNELDPQDPRPYNISDMQLLFDQFGIQAPQDCPALAMIAVPILCEGQAEGLLMGMRRSAVPYNLDTLQIAELYAGQTSAAIENARLYQTVQMELSERKQAEEAVRASDDRFRALIGSVSDVISILTSQGEFAYISPAARYVWGSPPEVLLNQNILDRVHPDDQAAMRELLAASLAQPSFTVTHHVRLSDGAGKWRDFEGILTNLIDELAVGGIVATFHDITERKTYEQELRLLAFRDPLTGLSNRAHFTDCLHQALARASIRGSSVAVIFFDLDNFKTINDTLGHAWGDRVLRIISDRLSGSLRKDDLAARFGGDEFTILLEGIATVEQVLPIVQRVQAVLREPISLNGREFLVGGSLGIALGEPNLDSADDLLRKADTAMYEAKTREKGSYKVYQG